MNKKVYTIFLIVCLAASGLSIDGVFAQTPKEFTRLRSNYQGLPPTSESLIPTGERTAEYYISPGDKLEIYVWQNGDLTKTTTVRSDGKLSYPLVGTIDVAGLTLDQLQAVITEKLSEYIRFPQVIVSLLESAGNKIVVLGQVNYPGIFTFKGSAISIIEVIAMAGDFTTDGRRESVMVISDNFTDHPKVRRIDVLTAIRNGVASKDILLKPDDVVYVPRSTIADVNKFLADIQPLLSTITTLINIGGTSMTTALQAKNFFWHRDLKIISSSNN